MTLLTKAQEEQTKLLATACNTAGINTVVVGLVAPLVAALYKVPSAPSAERILPACFIWLVMGFLLHLVGRFVLRDLSP